jgi:AbrB family looped-hinge helix DNA binding protein
MTSKSRVSKDHRIVVPKHVREALDIREGDILEWTTDGEQAVVRSRRRRTVDDITAIISVGGDAAQDKKRLARGELLLARDDTFRSS